MNVYYLLCGHFRKPTLSEEEDDRLLNGRKYVNLPEEMEDEESPSWREQGPDDLMETLNFTRNKTQTDPISYKPTGAPVSADDNYMESLRTQHRDNVKQMEAENRWRVLESHTPRHDIQALQNKYVHVKDKELPPTFYNHEGRYNEERAGLYKTSYEPEKLSYSISRQQTGDPSSMKNSLRRSTPNLSSDIWIENDENNAYAVHRADQRDRMQQTAESARTRVQEAGTISTESEYEQEYNVPKFLQEFKLAKHGRNEPLQVLSDQNKSLSNVRASAGRRSGKSVQFSNDVLVAIGTEAGPMLYSSVPVNGLTDDEKVQIAKSNKATVNTTQYVSNHAQWRKNQDLMSEKAIPRMKSFDTIDHGKEVFSASYPEIAKSARSGRRPITSDGITGRNDFNSKSSNFAPTDLRNSMTYQTAYQTQFPIYHSDTMDDPRFSWEPGCGTPRPGTQLLKIENRFCKSTVRKRFHDTFVEGAPDLRSHIFKGKKHTFSGQNAQTLRG